MFDEYDHISGVYLLVTIQIGKTLIEVYRILTHDIVSQKVQITLIHFAVEIDISIKDFLNIDELIPSACPPIRCHTILGNPHNTIPFVYIVKWTNT